MGTRNMGRCMYLTITVVVIVTVNVSVIEKCGRSHSRRGYGGRDRVH